MTARDAALLSEGDRFQTRGCSVSSLRHSLPQTLPSKQVSGLTLCSSFSRPGTEPPAPGNAGLGGMQDNTATWLGILYYVPFSILGCFHLKQMRTANSGSRWRAFLGLGAGKILLAKQIAGTHLWSLSVTANSSAWHEFLSYAHLQSFCTFLSVVRLKVQFQKCHFTQISRFSSFTSY